MLIDAYGRRGVPRYWIFIVLMPFGEIVYFFKFKIHDPDFAWLKTPFASVFERPPSIAELRYNVEQTPSLANKIALAEAVYDAGEYREATVLFEEGVGADDGSSDALYGLGVARIGLKDHAGAVKPLKKLIELDPMHRDYDAWAKLVHALWECERYEDALRYLASLVEQSPRLAHRMLYAHYLGRDRRNEQAQAQLVTALREHEYAPSYLRRRNRRLAKQAREMLQELSASS